MTDGYFIYLRGLEAQVSIGIHAHERAAPQRLRISAALFLRRRAQGDDIAAVIDYDRLRDRILGIAADRHFELQESLCEEIAAAALEEGVLGALVQTEKPDIFADTDAVGCRLARSAADGPEQSFLLTIPL